MKVTRTLLCAALGMLAFAPPSEALLHVCPTDSPGACAAQHISALPGEVIELRVPVSNGVNVTIDVSGGWIEGFNPEPSEIVEFHPISFNSTTTRIQIAGVRTIPTEPPVGAFRLGSLIVNAVGGGFQAWVVVGSNGAAEGDAIEDINPVVIPEPAQWLMLTAGATVLAALGRRRSRLAKHRV